MRKALLIAILGILVMVTAACGQSSNGSGDDSGNSSSEQETVTVTHELGETDVPKNPDKVVVFDFGILDTLDKLGIEVAGVPKDAIPSYLEKYEGEDYENAGSLKEPDFDKLAQINPDLIIISGRQASLHEQLMEIAPTIHLGVDTTRYMESFKENMKTVGKIFDKEEEIDQELQTLEKSIADLQEKASSSDKNALIILANDDKISAYGPSSRFGLIHDVFEVPAVDENIEASTHGMNVSFEYVVEQNPDMLYVIDRGAVVGSDSSAKQVVENELTKKTKAYQSDNIVYLDPDYWYLSGGGLVSVQEMINEISNSLD
ncbi:siderophore ABC transporter substrate-binding protein [Lentibacillus sp.]|jgi:iron complex transport system substrate-binding protein|uniref:siderophore ABC transporter substrate-binding protein n=1 Tax=Lentibacillus sp. TaxID=1925746 RepID=UPI002B4B6D52|nr:siderophore ABC transporter substrate-binding protein [Lentibacillus sp.]HLS09074.1 siderophore ABC transporter substrate-binding protein [Lentibacillus sp.]